MYTAFVLSRMASAPCAVFVKILARVTAPIFPNLQPSPKLSSVPVSTSSPPPTTPRPSVNSTIELIKIAFWPVFIVVAIGAIWFYLRPSRGLRELQTSRDAVRLATSWHSLRSTRRSDGSWVMAATRDVVCPTDFDETTIHPEQNGATERRVEVQGHFYSQLPTGVWTTLGNGFIRIPDCGRGPYLESLGNVYNDLDEIEQKGEVHRGGHLDTEGVKCQWWHITTANPTQPKYSVCLAEDSHFPLVVTSESYGFSYSFSKWNQTTITAPIPQ